MSLHVSSVRLEYEPGPFVPVSRPRTSWRTETATPDWTQVRAELEWTVAGRRESSVVEGAASVLVAWPFTALRPFDEGSLRVRVTGTDGATSEWSENVPVRAGFLGPDEWRASFVELPEPSERAEPFLVRREFEVRDGLVSALLFATAQGAYQAEINGTAVDDQVLKPGWTPYASRLVHETTDVTALLRPGRNVIGAEVAGGWFTEIYGFRSGAAAVYGGQPSFAAQLVLRYADGTTTEIITGPDWRHAASGTAAAGIYQGEIFDARLRPGGWSEPGFNDAAWGQVRTRDVAVLPGPRTSPVARAVERLPVRDVLTSPSGALLLDFGQNLVGYLEIRVTGQAGDIVRLRHAEVLEGGELCVRPLRRAHATDQYTLGGDGVETWHPRFTFHGFRYAEITGWPGEFDPADVTAVVVHSDMARTGWFRSSHPLVDRLHENAVWSMRGNFLYLPTDCPQRDERLGWTGDIQVFAPTATFLYETNGFLASWLVDLALEQKAIGGVPFIVPNVIDSARLPAAAWGDAATIVPWVLYERYGDVGVLAAQFDSMRAWVDQVLALTGPRLLWEGHFQFGDWLDPSAPADRPGDAKTDPDLVASAYLFRSARIVADTAAILGRDELAARYARVADDVRTAWLREYTTPAGRLMSDSPTAYALGIEFGLLDEEATARAGDRLAQLVRRSGYRIGTGFVGTPLIQDALVHTGHTGTATRLLTQTESPSWLHPVTMGATTIWERWDSMLEDGSINPGEMTSFNHYALGAVADWLHRVLAGLGPAEPGHRRLRIAPTPLVGFDHAEAVHDTPYGRASAGWAAVDGTIRITATVPPNTTADVELPDGKRLTVGSGSHEWVVDDPRPTPRQPVPVTVDTPLSSIIDDPEAYETAWHAIAAVDADYAHRFTRHTPWLDAYTFANHAIDIPPAVLTALTAALDDLNARRLG